MSNLQQQNDNNLSSDPYIQPHKSSSLFSAKAKTLLLLGIVVAIFLGAYALFGQTIKNGKDLGLPSIDTPKESPQKREVGMKQWINCDDIRQVIEKESLLYVACLGGVLIIDTNSGMVRDQITMTQGLSNSTATSMTKEGNMLYIGTQDGFTIFDLETREAKRVSIKEGLISGSNIVLTKDGNDLWVGSFSGLSLYKIDTGKIQNFTREIADNSTKYNANGILVTPQAIYATILANAYSPGGVARYDKVTQSWERFGPTAFDKTGQYARVDFFHIVRVGEEKIFVSDGDMLWEGENKSGTSWKKVDSVIGKIKEENAGQDASIIRIVGGDTTLKVLISGRMYEYNSSTGETKMIYPNFTHGENVLTNTSFIGTIENNNKVWITPSGNSSQKQWLRWFDLDSFKSGAISLRGRPEIFTLIATIDGKPLVSDYDGIWVYNLDSSLFEKLAAFQDLSVSSYEGGTQAVFRPLDNTAKIFVYNQPCGMGCPEPKILLYDYNEGSIKPFTIPDYMRQKITVNNSLNYYSVSAKDVDTVTREVIFVVEGKTDRFQLNLDTGEWKETVPVEEKQSFSALSLCNSSYTLKDNGGKFRPTICSDLTENQLYKWETEAGFPRNKLWQVDKKTGEKKELDPPLAPEEYSSFGPRDEFSIRGMIFAYDRLWIGTNRGLVSYDPTKETWKLFDTKDGLISDEVENFVIDENTVWVSTHWGGLSSIPR